MSYPPYCICCSKKAIWSSDWDAHGDFGYEHEGIIGLYICSSENCHIHMEVRDLFISEDVEERSIKYYYDHEGYPVDKINTKVNHCLYCNTVLNLQDTKPTDNNGEYSECVTSVYKCPRCRTNYEVEDLYPVEEIFNRSDMDLTIYDSRTVIIK